jgi:HK97 family phage major capsid protein
VKNVGVSTDTTTYAQVSALPTADVIAEGAELTETDATYVPRTLQTYSFRSATIISQEFEEDSIANPQNVIEPLVQSIADHIDNMFVNGSGSGEPLGIDNLTGMYMRLHLGANGAALTGSEELGALRQKARESNYNISSFVLSPRTLKEYRLLETTTEEIPKPNPFSDIPLAETNLVLNTDTQGTSSNATKIFAPDKKGVWAGWRYKSPNAVKFIVDRTTLAEFGKVRIYAYVRMGLAHPYGGACIGYVKGVIPPSGAIT